MRNKLFVLLVFICSVAFGKEDEYGYNSINDNIPDWLFFILQILIFWLLWQACVWMYKNNDFINKRDKYPIKIKNHPKAERYINMGLFSILYLFGLILVSTFVMKIFFIDLLSNIENYILSTNTIISRDLAILSIMVFYYVIKYIYYNRKKSLTAIYNLNIEHRDQISCRISNIKYFIKHKLYLSDSDIKNELEVLLEEIEKELDELREQSHKLSKLL